MQDNVFIPGNEGYYKDTNVSYSLAEFRRWIANARRMLIIGILYAVELSGNLRASAPLRLIFFLSISKTIVNDPRKITQ